MPVVAVRHTSRKNRKVEFEVKGCRQLRLRTTQPFEKVYTPLGTSSTARECHKQAAGGSQQNTTGTLYHVCRA
jgi:hypothetical protein